MPPSRDSVNRRPKNRNAQSTPSAPVNIENTKAIFSHIAPTLKLVWQSSKLGTLGLLGCSLLSAFWPLSMAWVGKLIVDAVIEKNTASTLYYIAVELALATAFAFTSRATTLLNNVIGSRLSVDLHLIILSKTLALSLKDFEDPEFYDSMTRARREASSRPVAMMRAVFQLFQHLFSLLGCAALVLGAGWPIVIALVISVIPATIAEMRFSKASFRLHNWRAPETRKLAYIESVLATDRYAKEVKLFGFGPLLLNRYANLSESFYVDDKNLSFKQAFWTFTLSLLSTVTYYASYVTVALSTAVGTMSLGTMTLYMATFRQGQGSFQAMLNSVAALYENDLYMSNLFAFLARPTSTNNSPSTIDSTPAQATSQPIEQSTITPNEKGIRFNNVSFRYPGAQTNALDSINLFIPAGQSLALVGHNGAGKTTFIKLLTRLYQPTQGEIYLDGKNLELWDTETLRNRFAVIFQDFNQYQLTIHENVGFGSIDHKDDQERIDRALAKGGASDFVKNLSKQKETMLGRWFDDGIELSGGQWQKIALSRGFMREEADILVLDEPTAALDAEAEHHVFARFRELTVGRTSILISHRFPTVRMADQIVLIENGEIVEIGSHSELLSQEGVYAKLFEMQASGYR